jgi:DNA-binding transcriptional ArsR family regulator
MGINKEFFLSIETLKIICSDVNNQFSKKIINHLSGVSEANVTTIWTKLRIEQSQASNHLGKLRKLGLVTFRKKGKTHFYKLNLDQIDEVGNAIERILTLTGKIKVPTNAAVKNS